MTHPNECPVGRDGASWPLALRSKREGQEKRTLRQASGSVAENLLRPTRAPRPSLEHREIINLVYYHEKSIDECAQILGIPAATVKTRMFYARKKLAELVKDA